MDLKLIRDRIDLLDSKILKLLNDRMELGLLAGKFKEKIEDLGRETELLERIKKKIGMLVDEKFCLDLFRDIIEKTKEIQRRDYRTIAFQGERGAYSEVAARVWSKEEVPIPCKEFIDVFQGVSSGYYDYGIVPVENTLGGVVGDVNDLMTGTNLFVVGAVDLKIHHCLLTMPDIDYRDIKKVYSHPQALAQCREFLSRNNLEWAPYYDTAGAAMWIAEKMPKASAAIASSLCADIYNLELVKENIEDLKENRTRFLLLSKKEFEGSGSKCSAVFSTEHKAGVLFKVLELFAKEKINLTRIESVPSVPGSYVFFLDFIGNKNDDNVKKVIEKVKKETLQFRLIGCYNERIG